MSESAKDESFRGTRLFAPVPYAFLDVLLTEVLRNAEGYAVERTTLTLSSCIYTIALKKVQTPKNQPIGMIRLRQGSDKVTFIDLIPDRTEAMNNGSQYLEGILADVWATRADFIRSDEARDSIDSLQPSTGILQALAELQPRRLEMDEAIKRKEPARKASIDRWLDWREIEAKHGRKVTLQYIAGKTDYTLSTIKKHSAKRKKPKSS